MGHWALSDEIQIRARDYIKISSSFLSLAGCGWALSDEK
jgi:hypothetical protein